MNDLLKKYGIIAAALAVAFAAGRYTMRTSVKSEIDSQYAEKYKEFTAKTESEYVQKLASSTESLKKELEAQTSKNQKTHKKTVIAKDGTTTITEDTSSKETSKKKETSTAKTTKKEETVATDTKTEQTTKEDTKKESTKSITSTTPPPSWRVYAAAALSTPALRPTASYGAGAMYDIGPVNVGGFGLFSPEKATTTLGVTLGLSF